MTPEYSKLFSNPFNCVTPKKYPMNFLYFFILDIFSFPANFEVFIGITYRPRTIQLLERALIFVLKVLPCIKGENGVISIGSPSDHVANSKRNN